MSKFLIVHHETRLKRFYTQSPRKPQDIVYSRVGEDTFEMYLRYRYMRGCIFCIFRYLRYRYH